MLSLWSGFVVRKVRQPGQRKHHLISIFGYSGIIRLTQLPEQRSVSSCRRPAGKDNTWVSHLHWKRFTLLFIQSDLKEIVRYPDLSCSYLKSKLKHFCSIFLFLNLLLEIIGCHILGQIKKERNGVQQDKGNG